MISKEVFVSDSLKSQGVHITHLPSFSLSGVVAFVSGGGLPKNLAGGKREGMMHIADMHATICE